MRSVRSAVIVLLFVNLVFMAWGRWVDRPPEAAVNRADAKLPRLLLSDEQPKKLVAEPPAMAAAIAASDPSTATAASAEKRCMSVGPFNDAAQKTRAATLLHQRGFTPKERTSEGEVPDGYWVYLGGLKSAADETRALKILQEAGLNDAHAVPASDDGRRVSVGLFTERTRAERRARAVQHLGFSPDIVDRRRPGTVYWIDLDLTASDGCGSD